MECGEDNVPVQGVLKMVLLFATPRDFISLSPLEKRVANTPALVRNLLSRILVRQDQKKVNIPFINAIEFLSFLYKTPGIPVYYSSNSDRTAARQKRSILCWSQHRFGNPRPRFRSLWRVSSRKLDSLRYYTWPITSE